MLVQEQQLRRTQRRHEQRQRLPLAAGEQAYLAGHAVFQPQIQHSELFPVHIPFHLADAPAQPALLSAPHGQGQVLFDVHGGGGSRHRVLKDAAQVARPFEFRQGRHVHAADLDLAAVNGEYARDCVQHGGFSRAVAADHGDEIPFRQMQIHAQQGLLLRDRAGVEGLLDVRELKHASPPSSGMRSFRASTAQPGIPPPPAPSAASGRWR